MNRLKHETSPYLLQHAENPVDWYPWGQEALRRAREEDKPILVSIGYSTCHWCHVMERESFENEDVAEFMNTHFVNIKVDREERPDIDQIYMEAVQILTGGGGWPLNCFLTPDGRPFYGGTYYPPEPMHRRPSWMQLLRHLRQTFRNKRDTVEEQADKLTDLLGRSEQRLFETAASMVLDATKGEGPDQELLDHFFRRLQDDFDAEEGGLGGAPKFPSTMALSYLLHYYHYSRKPEALEHVQFSLRKMIWGGIYDQLGGGFARYAVDKAWLVPHFEKMLYDNALLVGLMADTYRYTGEEELRQIIAETLAFVNRELSHPEGGFYSALDADSEGEEGKFYVWSKEEVDEVLSQEQSAVFCAFYDVTTAGNWEGKSILHRHLSLAKFAERQGKPEAEVKQMLEEARGLLFERRAKRVRPGLDDKVLLSWNALMVIGFLRAARATGEAAWADRGLQALQFFEEKMQRSDGKGYYHTYKDGEARQAAFLDDYAYLIRAWLEAYQQTGEAGWLAKAGDLADLVIDEFWDEKASLFFYTTVEQKDILLRKKELFDNAMPSGNAVMAINLLQLAVLLDRPAYTNKAGEMYEQVMNALKRFPTSFCEWLTGATMMAHGFYELAVVGPEYRSMAAELRQLPLLNTLTAAAPEGEESLPLLRGKTPVDGKTAIFLCKNYSCRRPVTTIEAFMQLIEGDKS